MRFMLILKADADTDSGVMPPEALLAAVGRYTQLLQASRALLGAETLLPSAHGARVTYAAGAFKTSEGPFPELQGTLAAYWLVRTASKQEAIALAQRWGEQDGEIEVREVFEVEDFPMDESERPGGWRDQELAFRDAPPVPAAASGKLRFLGLIKADAGTEAGAEPAPALLDEMGALMTEVVQAGDMIAGDGLKPSRQGARVHFLRGQSRVVDGPFAETKELIAGFMLHYASSLAEAVELARRCLEIHVRGTDSPYGSIEVRQVWSGEGACHG